VLCSAPMDGIHDLGGMHGFGAVVTPGSEAPYHERWEARVFAVHALVSGAGLTARPGGRATREEMDPAHYLAASYYERWLWSAEQGLLRKGTIQPGEVDRMMERLADGEPEPRRDDPALAELVLAELRRAEPAESAGTARFAPGDRVRVRRMRPAGHTCCPRYVRGASGVVERVHLADRLPDLAVYGKRPPPEPVYAVAFSSEALWGRSGEPPCTVSVDLWESYLEAAP
jgi:nitrile hydratase subunit beta